MTATFARVAIFDTMEFRGDFREFHRMAPSPILNVGPIRALLQYHGQNRIFTPERMFGWYGQFGQRANSALRSVRALL